MRHRDAPNSSWAVCSLTDESSAANIHEGRHSRSIAFSGGSRSRARRDAAHVERRRFDSLVASITVEELGHVELVNNGVAMLNNGPDREDPADLGVLRLHTRFGPVDNA